ncbi:beta-L-arabinofuranosidase domain-containing protein [Proteiniphilum sp.]|uniref:beta-L-arabinofuranosidase domain-containing protein n=1 Tax=Proteiniphilum sp. TaxID=1926877 RepID=UPI002B1F368C|nr:beta-L-arabinofuranosidase domain-containing protein [Proteiniphilum sp.]MEA4918205.1 glycoside hydrolase family 127 protein [Proteiniphilum sp.]
MDRKKLNWIIICFTCIPLANAQINPQVEYFRLQDVRLLDSPFKHAEELNRQYLLEMDVDRLLAPFLREAGLPQKAESYANWENSGLDGHIGGHYLSGLALMYASTGDAQVKSRLDYMLAELKRCQDANGNGYIGGVPGGKAIWEEVAAGNIRAGGFDLNGKWVPLYNIHKTYAGLRDAWLVAGNEEAKEMLIKMTDWAIKLVSNLSEEQLQDMLRSEHGGLNETFADVAAITGDKKYLELAHKFSHQLILDPLIHHQDKLTGMHANTQIPKVLGFKRIADLEGNGSWEEAARFFWKTVVENRSVSIGGNSVSEHFNPVDDFSRMISSIEGPETCNTYNMLRLTKMLYQTSKEKKYVDYYERALYNHILSSQHPNTGGFVYLTQMRPGHYRVYSQPHTSMWCCVGSGMESHSKYGEMIYAHANNQLYVNLFIASSLQWRAQDTEIIQENNFPYEAKTEITVNPRKRKRLTLWLRYPGWAGEGSVKVTVNGKVYPVLNKNGYIPIDRKWKKGDKVVMEMPMSLRTEQLPDGSGYYSFLYGPVVLAAKTGTEEMTGLFADDSRNGHIAHGRYIPMKNMPLLVGDPDKLTSYLAPVPGKPLTFRVNNLYPEQYARGMELEPFFNLHESRYIIYWPHVTEKQVKESESVAYLFTYFTGNRVEEESVRYAISSNGYNYYTLNNNRPVIDSKKISSTGGVRDPHILRGEDGKTFYMVLTDMTSSKGWDSNRAMILLKSSDLINWSSSIINIQQKYEGQEDLKRVWAPQTIYDPEAGKYMVYWSMLHGDGADIIYYAYANDDFTDLEGEPRPLFLPKNGKSCIDGDIVLKDGLFHMFYKTEGHGNGIKLATTCSLTSGQWTEYDDYKQQTAEAVEGSSLFRLIDSDKYILMYDVYMKGAYQFTESTDLMNFKVIDHEISMDFHPRHGSIIPITQKELDALIVKWGKPENFSANKTNPVLKGFFADPYALYSNKTNKYYIYPTSDGYHGWSGTYFKTFSSENLSEWKDEGVILDLKKDVSWAERNAWAPCIIEKKREEGYKYYYYFTAAQKIGVAVADDPAGPFVDSGKPLIDFKPEGVRGGQEIDPDVFWDPVTKKNYLYWGNGYMAVAELNDDMVSIKRNTIKVMTPDNTFREAIHVFYRNGIYYFLWSEDDTRSENYRVRYATSTSPVGPLTIPENNLILSKSPEEGIWGTGHNSTLKIKDKDEWYIVYHRFFRPEGIHWGDAAGYHREVCIDRMEFNEDGSIKAVVPTTMDN